MAITNRDAGYDIRLGGIKTVQTAERLNEEIGQMLANAEQIKSDPDLNRDAASRKWREAVDRAQAHVVSTVRGWMNTADDIVRRFEEEYQEEFESHEKGINFARLSFVARETEARLANARLVDNPVFPATEVVKTVLASILEGTDYYAVRALRAVTLPEFDTEAPSLLYAQATERMNALSPASMRTLAEYVDEARSRRKALRDALEAITWGMLAQMSDKRSSATLQHDWRDMAVLLDMPIRGDIFAPVAQSAAQVA